MNYTQIILLSIYYIIVTTILYLLINTVFTHDYSIRISIILTAIIAFVEYASNLNLGIELVKSIDKKPFIVKYTPISMIMFFTGLMIDKNNYKRILKWFMVFFCMSYIVILLFF